MRQKWNLPRLPGRRLCQHLEQRLSATFQHLIRPGIISPCSRAFCTCYIGLSTSLFLTIHRNLTLGWPTILDYRYQQRADTNSVVYSLHHRNFRSVQLFYHLFRWDTDSANEHCNFVLNEHVCEPRELTLRVVVLQRAKRVKLY